MTSNIKDKESLWKDDDERSQESIFLRENAWEDKWLILCAKENTGISRNECTRSITSGEHNFGKVIGRLETFS